LVKARQRIGSRVDPSALDGRLAEGALVVDIRPVELRTRDGEIDGAVVVDRNVLEWRLDPTSPHRLPGFDDETRPVIIVCDEGYASSLAAAGLMELGLTNVTDLEGGFQAWRQYRGG
jgi:rhodanese-related sulfurtransferase